MISPVISGSRVMERLFSLRRWKASAQGMVEFALVLPLLLLMIYGIIEAGRLMFIYSMVLTSSREAARYGAASGDINSSSRLPRYRDCSGIRAAARRVGGLAGIQDGDITILYDRGPSTATIAHCNSTFTITAGSGTIITQGDRVIVQVVATYRPLLPGITRFSSFPITSVTRRTLIKDVEVGGTPPPPVPPTVFFATSSQERSESAGEILVRVQMSAASSKAVTIPYSISGTATEGESADFTITPSPVFISPGDISVDIVIQINDDEMDEPDETIVLTMGNPTNADKGSPDLHVITITDNDDPPFVFFTSGSQSQEEDQDIFINLQLSAASSFEITVFYTVTGTASQGENPDYFITSSPVTIPPGSTSVSIVATVVDDAMDEDDETIIVTIDDMVNAQRGSPDVHVATIVDNDLPPFVAFTWAESSADEPAGRLIVQLQLSAISAKEITVPFSVSGEAELGVDYSISDSPVVIPAGSETGEIAITILDDEDPTEDDEKIVLTILEPTNAMIGTPDVHTATIVNEFVPPTVSFTLARQTVDESIEGKQISVEVRLSHASPEDITVPFSVGGTAEQAIDYTISGSPVTIPAGGASEEIVITIIDDALDENDETVVITMGTPTNATKGSPSTHVVTIVDDDDGPSVYFALESQSVVETAGLLQVFVQLSAASGLDITVPFIHTGTAEEGVDYSVAGSPVLIPAGSFGAEITLTVIDDNLIEPDEQVTITLENPTNAALGSPVSHTIRIKDDDPNCPTAASLPYFGPASDKDWLIWPLQTSNPLVIYNLKSVTIQWPVTAENVVTSITFGNQIYSGTAPPPFLAVNTPDPLWTGIFDNRNLIFIFNKNRRIVAGDLYQVTATFENCSPISATIPSN